MGHWRNHHPQHIDLHQHKSTQLNEIRMLHEIASHYKAAVWKIRHYLAAFQVWAAGWFVTDPDASENGISISLQRLQMCRFVVAAHFAKSILIWYRMSGNNRGLLSWWWPRWCRKGTEEAAAQPALIAAREEKLATWRWAGLIEGSWSY